MQGLTHYLKVPDKQRRFSEVWLSGGTLSCNTHSSFVPVHHGPRSSFLGRTGDFHDDIIGAGGRREYSSGRESTPLPGVVFGQFSFAVIQMDRHLGILYV